MLIDVSHNNGLIDWAKVKSDPQGITGAILKATEGVNSVDNRFAGNVAGCVKNGLKWGAYHFATFNSQDVVADAKAEAAHFIQTVQAVGKPDMPMVLDAETNNPLTISKDKALLYLQTFLKELESAGCDTAIYMSPGFIESWLPVSHGLGNYKLWIAHYTTKPHPRTPGWVKEWLWQYSDQGHIKGINGNVDLNRG